jgi:hypothetical protein
MRVPTVIFSLTIVAAPLSGQALTTDVGIRDIGTLQVTLADRINSALALPFRTVEMREAGVPDRSIRELLEVMEARNLPGIEQLDILTTERDAVREGKPHADFGAFVQGRLDAGARGTGLAQEIRTERLRRTPDSIAAEQIAVVDLDAPVSQLPDPAHTRHHGSRRWHNWTWGKRP